MAKIDVLNKALEMGLDATEEMTIAEIQKLIDAAEATGGNPPKKQEPKKFVYPNYDLWKIDKEDIANDRDGEPKKAKFTAVKIIRSAVKIEHNAAISLNAQSHNNLRRYYESGSIQNGFEETVTIK